MNNSMEEWIAEQNDIETKLMSDLNISRECAQDVVYLRTRNRHTEKLEKELIELHAKRTPPNMCEFGCTEATGQALLDSVMNTVANNYSPNPGAY